MLNKNIIPEKLPISGKPIFQRNITIFDNKRLDFVGFVPLEYWLFDDEAKEIEDVISYRCESSDFVKAEIYKSLPFASISSVLRYDNETMDYFPIGYTGLMDFDIRQDNNPDFGLLEIVTELAKLPQIAYLGLDTNGKDYFGIIPISNPNRYAEHFRALKSILAGQGVFISGSENVLHTRKVSIDFDHYANPKATVFSCFGC